MENKKRLISLDEALKETHNELYWTESQQAAVRSFLVKQPKVDAVEAVRCGTCLYYSETIGKDSGKPCGYGVCTKPFHITNIVANEDFCSFGQMRADAKRDGE